MVPLSLIEILKFFLIFTFRYYILIFYYGKQEFNSYLTPHIYTYSPSILNIIIYFIFAKSIFRVYMIMKLSFTVQYTYLMGFGYISFPCITFCLP